MKIFLDTANIELIEKWILTGIIDGVTTNPSLIAKEGANIKQTLQKICSIVPGDVSIEVVEKEPEKVYKQAIEISKFAPNVCVKIPFDQKYLPVIAKLVKEKINLNITLIFSLFQALLVAKLGVKYISPFIGRWDDIDVDGINLIKNLMIMKKNYNLESKIIAASIRGVMHLHKLALIGVDIATIPPKILQKVMYHPLTEKGIEKFDADWKKLNKKNLFD